MSDRNDATRPPATAPGETGVGTASQPARDRQVLILTLSGELSIKAKGTRNRFVDRLVKNLADALRDAGIRYEIRRSWSRVFVHADSDRAAELAARVFGVRWVAPAQIRPWETLDDLVDAGEELCAEAVAGKTFAVRARRGSEAQKVPFRSPELERALGARLLPHAAGVDLKAPEVTVRLELHRDRAYFAARRIAAHGGLPIGTEGRALALLSGGFDSGVAAWLMLRRGARLDYLFFNLAGDAHRDAVLEVAKILADGWSFGYRPRLHVVDFRPVVEALRARCPQSFWQVVLKRQMLRAADRVARASRVPALVTGEVVGQVSSQTLQNLAVISAATPIQVLRPLAGAHKEEIVALARRIGTHDASATVPELCDLAPRQPETHARADRVERAESRLDLDLPAALAGERAVFDLRALDLDRLAAPELEVDRVPAGATVLDLRPRAAYRSWHYPGALQMDYVEALKAWPHFDREKTYLCYCEIGLKSAHLAELMHEAGFRAHHFQGGLKPLRRHVDESPAGTTHP